MLFGKMNYHAKKLAKTVRYFQYRTHQKPWGPYFEQNIFTVLANFLGLIIYFSKSISYNCGNTITSTLCFGVIKNLLFMHRNTAKNNSKDT